LDNSIVLPVLVFNEKLGAFFVSDFGANPLRSATTATIVNTANARFISLLFLSFRI
jgi:hypothetical protein